MKDLTFQKKIQAAYKRNVIVVDKKNITNRTEKPLANTKQAPVVAK